MVRGLTGFGRASALRKKRLAAWASRLALSRKSGRGCRPPGTGRGASRISGRGRDGSYLPPPAQIPACGFPAPGSCRKSGVVDVRGLGGPYSIDPRADASRDMLDPALCPGHASASSSPPGRVPSLHTLRRRSSRPCSGFHRYYGPVRLLRPSDPASAPRLPEPTRNRLGGCGPSEVSQVPTRSLRP